MINSNVYKKYDERVRKEGIYIKIQQGYICGEYNIKEGWAELGEIYIHKKYRHQGYARKLIHLFEIEVKKLGIKKIGLFADINTLAKFIGRMGYVKENTYIFYEKLLNQNEH